MHRPIADSDSVRCATGLPVFDAINACNFFMSGVQDHPRFGCTDWRAKFDGVQEDYKCGLSRSHGHSIARPPHTSAPHWSVTVWQVWPTSWHNGEDALCEQASAQARARADEW